MGMMDFAKTVDYDVLSLIQVSDPTLLE